VNGVAFDSDADSANSAEISTESRYGVGVFTPDELSFEAQLESAVKNGTLTNGNGLYGEGDVCNASGPLSEFNG